MTRANPEQDARAPTPTVANQSGDLGELPHRMFDRQELRVVTQRFQKVVPRTALWQLASTFLPLLAVLATMHAGLALGWWWALLLGLPAAGLTVRVFALQHDCGRSLARSRDRDGTPMLPYPN